MKGTKSANKSLQQTGIAAFGPDIAQCFTTHYYFGLASAGPLLKPALGSINLGKKND